MDIGLKSIRCHIYYSLRMMKPYHGCVIHVCRTLQVKVSCREVPNQHPWATVLVQDALHLFLILN